MEIYQNILYDIIKSMVKKCDSFQGLLKGGVLVLIINNGIVYTIDISDRIPLDVVITTYFNAGRMSQPNYEYDPLLEYQIRERVSSVMISPFDNVIFFDPEIASNPTFDLMRNSNTTEGGFKLILDSMSDFKIITILYKGVFNLNKKDNISLRILDKDPIHPGIVLLFEYTVYKDKIKKEYKITYLTFNLWRRRNDITS